MRHVTRCVAVACLFAAASLVGCSSGPEVQDTPTTEVPLDEVEMVEVLGKAGGDMATGIGQTVTRLTEPQFREMSLARPGFEPDFAKHDVVLLTLGEQPTGGYAADITALQRVGDTLYVQATATAPGPAAEVTQVVTHPFSAVIIDKQPEDIILRSDITSVQ